MIESMNGRSQNPEYPIGSLVPILQHSCAPGKLGLQGRVNSLSNNVPVTAACVDCSKSVTVDVASLKLTK